MTARSTKRPLLSLIRADISALMIIAFVFQLVWPVVVLAGPMDDQSAFEQDLRASICRVHIDTSAPTETEKTLTDGFVCDFCVLSALQAIPNNDSLPEYVKLDPQASLPQANGAYSGSIPEHIFQDGETSPRSPPFS